MDVAWPVVAPVKRLCSMLSTAAMLEPGALPGVIELVVSAMLTSLINGSLFISEIRMEEQSVLI